MIGQSRYLLLLLLSLIDGQKLQEAGFRFLSAKVGDNSGHTCGQTRNKCTCLDSWSIGGDGSGQVYKGCSNPGGSKNPWCVVQDSCAFPRGHLINSGQPIDFCAPNCIGPVVQRLDKTVLGCQCKKDWESTFSNGNTSNGCYNPDNDALGQWCVVDEKTCEYGDFAGYLILTDLTYVRFDYCFNTQHRLHKSALPSAVGQDYLLSLQYVKDNNLWTFLVPDYNPDLPDQLQQSDRNKQGESPIPTPTFVPVLAPQLSPPSPSPAPQPPSPKPPLPSDQLPSPFPSPTPTNVSSPASDSQVAYTLYAYTQESPAASYSQIVQMDDNVYSTLSSPSNPPVGQQDVPAPNPGSQDCQPLDSVLTENGLQEFKNFIVTTGVYDNEVKVRSGLTIFAPSNDAISAFADAQKIDIGDFFLFQSNVDAIKQIAKLHVVLQSISADDLTNLGTANFPTLIESEELVVTNEAPEVVVASSVSPQIKAKVFNVMSPFQACEGLVYIIDTVLEPQITKQ